MRNELRRLALTVAVVTAAAACTSQPSPSASPSVAVTPLTPKPGGTLTFAVAGDPPSFDPHRETDPVVLQVLAPFYSVLYRNDPDHPAEILPDVAQGQPSFSADGLTVTVKLRTDARFQDGSALTSADVLATYEKIVFPPDSVVSPRKIDYVMVDTVSASDPSTVVFRLKRPAPSFKVLLASPWNVIESAARLRADARWYEKNVDGSGPFAYVSNTPGKEWVAKKNPAYYATDASGARLPYLDGYRALVIPDDAARADAVARGDALVDFGGFLPDRVNAIVSALGDNAAVQQGGRNCVNDILPNGARSALGDVRVRQALSLAVNKYGATSDLAATTPLHDVGGLMRPKSLFELNSQDLQALKGYGTDAAKNRTDAKKLLADAGATSLRLTLLTSDAAVPYDAIAGYLIDQWRQAGVTVTRDERAPAAYAQALRGRDYDIALDVACASLDEPDVQLARFRGAFGDGTLDGMIDAQSAERDATKRAKAVADIEKYVLDDKAYAFPLGWWWRVVPYARQMRGWRILPGDGAGQDLATVWLSR